MAKQEVGLKIDVDVKSVGNMKQELRAATQELIAVNEKFGSTSKQAMDAAKRVANLKDAIGDAKALADTFNPDKKFVALGGAVQGAVAGFSALQGAIGLFGSESKEVEKILLKVQSAMALQQGISGIAGAADSFKLLSGQIATSNIVMKANAAATTLTSGVMRALGISVNTTSTSFKVLRTAIISTGIGALVVAIGFAVEALMNLADSSDEAAKAEKELEKQQKRTEDAIRLKNKALEDSIKATNDYAQIQAKQAKLEGKSEEEILKIQRDALQKKIDLRKKDLDDTDNNNAINFEKIEAYGQAVRELQNFDLDQQIKRQEESQKKQEELRRKGRETRAKKDEEDRKKREDAEKVLDDARRALLTERQREEEDAQRVLEQGKEVLIKAGITNFLNLELQYQETLKSIKIKYETEEKQRIEKEQQEKLEKDKERQNKDLQNKQANFDAIRSQTETANAALVQAEVQLQNAKFEAASSGLNAIANLSQGNEKLANVIFAIDKGLAIAKIVVDTQREIGGYFATYSGLGPAGVAAAAKFSLGAKLRAAASIATIAATTIAKFKKSSGGAAGAAGGGISTSAPVAPQLAPQVMATQVNTAAVNQMGNRAARAYVLNADIQNEQQRNAYIDRNASIGNP